MGFPKIIRMGIGSRYVSKAYQQFCSEWNIEHKKGIPYNSQGHGIVYLAHGSLKT